MPKVSFVIGVTASGKTHFIKHFLKQNGELFMLIKYVNWLMQTLKYM